MRTGTARRLVAALALTAAAALPLQAQTITQAAYIKAGNGGEMDQFGFAAAVSADGSTMAIGAPKEDGDKESKYDSGAVYIYTRAGGGWTQQAYLKANDADEFDQFGNAVALSADGTTLVVGAFYEKSAATGVNAANAADTSKPQAGAAYVFVRRGATWTQQAYLKASNTDESDQFGFGVAISGDGNTVAIGAPAEDSNAKGVNGNQQDNSVDGAGAVYVFARSGTAWAQQAYLKSDSARGNDKFGYSVALSANGNTLASGVYDEAGSSREINGPLNAEAGGTGAAYVFTRAGTAWTKQAYIKAKEGDRQDSFGCSIALSADGNTLAVGAFDEDTLKGGINAVEPGHSGTVDAPDDLSVGAAYVFVRNGTTWTQQAAFKASNPGRNYWFGFSVALSGDGNSFAVASPFEKNAARGINGNQKAGEADESGAVYLFNRRGAQWSQTAYVKASNAQEYDNFGSSLALDGKGATLVVGAHYEDSNAQGVNGNQADDSLMDSGAAYVFAIR